MTGRDEKMKKLSNVFPIKANMNNVLRLGASMSDKKVPTSVAIETTILLLLSYCSLDFSVGFTMALIFVPPHIIFLVITE